MKNTWRANQIQSVKGIQLHFHFRIKHQFPLENRAQYYLPSRSSFNWLKICTKSVIQKYLLGSERENRILMLAQDRFFCENRSKLSFFQDVEPLGLFDASYWVAAPYPSEQISIMLHTHRILSQNEHRRSSKGVTKYSGRYFLSISKLYISIFLHPTRIIGCLPYEGIIDELDLVKKYWNC